MNSKKQDCPRNENEYSTQFMFERK